MKLLVVLTVLLLAIVYGLSRVSKSAAVRKIARLIIRIAGYALAALSVLMVILSFSNESGTFTLLLLAAAPAFASWLTFRLYEHSLSLEQG